MEKKRHNEDESVQETRTALPYGANIEDNDDPKEKRGVIKPWYKVHDTDEDAEEENRWTNLNENESWILRLCNVLFPISLCRCSNMSWRLCVKCW